jgi:4-aminobutyrate aminotransferase-like enzyme
MFDNSTMSTPTSTTGNLLLLAPPLIIHEHDLTDALGLLDRLLGKLAGEVRRRLS